MIRNHAAAMHFDDRLATVLRSPAGGETARGTQFRQLLDLLGTLPAEARGAAIDEAYVRLSELGAQIPVAERVAALGASGLRLRSPRLLAELAGTERPVAAPAIRAAQLREHQWLDLIPALPLGARNLVRQRRDLGPNVEVLLARLGIRERALPASAERRPIAANDVQVGPKSPPASADEGIGAIVRRIEAYRQRQAATAKAAVAEATLPPERVEQFAFSCDEAGRIAWADSAAAPAVVGTALRKGDMAEAQARALKDRFARRQPLHGVLLTLPGAPAVAGEWQVDAAPQFDALGRFTGYLGCFRRPTVPTAAPAAANDSDRLRQLLHELRTPVNAIQGFAEVIQQQLFGPTPHEYRALAAAIAGDAARMLAGFDELDRLARLDTGALALMPGTCDLAEIATGIADQLGPHLERRNARIELDGGEVPLPLAIDRDEAERLVWRVLATCAGAAAPGETLRLRLRAKNGMARLNLFLPATLARQEDIYRTDPQVGASAISASTFGAGFALRLASSEARAAGGSMARRGEKVRLELPLAADRLTTESGDLTQTKGLAARPSR